MKIRTKRILRWLVGVLALGAILIQFVPVDRTNPPVTSEIQVSVEVGAVLKRACYDCHSNETEWPWYSRVAPISWLIAHDVREGRKALNFSTWGELGSDSRVEMLAESWEEVEEDEMPPWFYIAPHQDARLTTKDKAVLRVWALAGVSSRALPEHEDE
ncbi:heme-binding domain-containing protein [Planctomycetota bacterium]|jgi:hypothetical protein|nr:heme-binding domain-containing protein [Planctomycetota bacterium]